MDEKETHFANAERKPQQVLKVELEKVLNNSVVTELLYVLSGVVMIINDDRQILTANKSFLQMAGIDSPQELLGLRPGEVLDCVHAHDHAGGCGTGQACASCGAALAIVTSLCTDKPVERYCALQIRKNGQPFDLYLRVIATPIHVFPDEAMILVCMQDVTSEHKRANLERIFYHDINNLITALLSLTFLISEKSPKADNSDYLGRLQNICDRLAQEVAIQQLLTNHSGAGIVQHNRRVSVKEIMDELSAIYMHHPKALLRRISFPRNPSGQLESDPGLIVRILGNMLTNALEATSEGGEIVLALHQTEQETGFTIWNDQHIPESIQPRIFQRHFSTKDGFERGLGTFAMKLLGEQILGGRVEFTTSPAEGTSFTLWLPDKQDSVESSNPDP